MTAISSIIGSHAHEVIIKSPLSGLMMLFHATPKMNITPAKAVFILCWCRVCGMGSKCRFLDLCQFTSTSQDLRCCVPGTARLRRASVEIWREGPAKFQKAPSRKHRKSWKNVNNLRTYT